MDEIDDNVRASLNEVIDAEFLRHDEREDGEPIPNFDAAAFTHDVETEAIAGLVSVSDDEDTGSVGSPEEKEIKKIISRNGKEFCRMCLCNDRQLSTISPQNRVAFQCVIRPNESKKTEPKLSQKVCWACNARMSSFRVFRTKAIQNNTLLYSLIRPFMEPNEQTTSERPQESSVHIFGNSRCIIHRQNRSRPYNVPTGENVPRVPRQLSFCVLQRSARNGFTREPRQPE